MLATCSTFKVRRIIKASLVILTILSILSDNESKRHLLYLEGVQPDGIYVVHLRTDGNTLLQDDLCS